MNDEDFKGIMDGLGDAVAFAKGDAARARVVRGPDVRALRAKTKLSQPAFAKKLRISPATVRDWEQGRRVPDAPARTLLAMIEADTKSAMELLERIPG